MIEIFTTTAQSGIVRILSFSPAICTYNPAPIIDQCRMEWKVSRFGCAVWLDCPTGWYLSHVRGQVGNQAIFQTQNLAICKYSSPARLLPSDSADWLDGKINYSNDLKVGQALFDRFIADPGMLWPELERLLVWLEGKQNEK